MQTKETKEKKSKKTVPPWAGQFFHHGVYMKNYWVSINSFFRPRVIALIRFS